MKKKFIAVACAMALALAIPAGAMAADGDTEESGTGTNTPAASDPADEGDEDADAGDEAASGPFTVTEEDGTVTIEVAEGTFTHYEYGSTEPAENILEEITITGAKEGSVTANPVSVGGFDENGDYYGSIDTEKYGEDAVKEYVEKLNQVYNDKGRYMFSMELKGEVAKGEDYAVVTFQLNKDLYGGKTITYYILHEDGTIQTKVVNVHADGTVRIHMKSFSIVTFIDVEGITKYENMVEPQDGDALSPKTGC